MDLRFARLMALYANAHRGEATPAFSPDDFMPKFGETDDEAEEDEAVTGEGAAVAPETKAWLYAMAGKKPNGN